jgi:hypothetical protein
VSLTFTLFRDYAATEKAQKTVTVDDLCNLIRDTSAPGKGELPWLKLARFGNSKTDKGSLRHDRNVIVVTGIEADYDGEVMSFDEAVEILDKAGIHAVIYTSPSHLLEKPRWRVLCPFLRELPPAERAHMIGRLNGLFGGIFSAESWTLSQAYYYGSVNGNSDHRVETVDGTQFIDQCDELDEIWIGKPDTKQTGNGVEQPRSGSLDEAALIENIISGEAYHVSCTRLLGRWAQQGVAFMDAQRRLLGYFDDVFPPDRDARWQQRRDDVPRLVRDIYGKEAEQQDARDGEADPLQQQPIDDDDWASINPNLLTGMHWLTRDIPEPDFMLGELLSTTSRSELIGPTGIGKTNVLIAMALAVADGHDFLHWRGCGKPRQVLYIDGEMSRRLTKKRLADAARRHGSMPPTFHCLNREDFQDLPPLNTENGQKFIDAAIEAISGADCVIFDNVQALLSGDMKDEEPWQQTLSWIRDLTRRGVGQIWAHHTGHDETHGYGSKTREWQLDTVALLERIECPKRTSPSR